MIVDLCIINIMLEASWGGTYATSAREYFQTVHYISLLGSVYCTLHCYESKWIKNQYCILQAYDILVYWRILFGRCWFYGTSWDHLNCLTNHQRTHQMSLLILCRDTSPLGPCRPTHWPPGTLYAYPLTPCLGPCGPTPWSLGNL